MTAMADHDRHLAICADHLRAATDGDKPLLAGAQGLRSLLSALASGQPLDPQLVGETTRLLFAVAPRIADAASGRLAPEHCYTALGCANAALTCREASRRFDLIAFAAVLEAEIRALHLRDMITAGSQIDLAVALFRNPVVAPPYLAGSLTVH